MFMVLLCFNFIYGIDRAPNLFVCVETSTCLGIGDSWSCPHVAVEVKMCEFCTVLPIVLFLKLLTLMLDKGVLYLLWVVGDIFSIVYTFWPWLYHV
jgi:hypothetical protein